METLFSRVIREHLALRERNAELNGVLPPERYFPGGVTTSSGVMESPPAVGDIAEIDSPRIALPVGDASTDTDTVDPSWSSPRSFDWGD